MSRRRSKRKALSIMVWAGNEGQLEMKAVILGAGYGTRLQKDLETESSGKYNHLRGLSKLLLPCGHRTIVDHLIDFINASNQINEIYIVTNSNHYPQFLSWAKQTLFPEQNIINDGTVSNENRLGTVADLALAVRKKEINEDLLVIAGDTLFYPDVELSQLVDYFKRKGGSTISRYQIKEEEVHKRGIGVFNHHDLMTSLLEKPNPAETSSRWAIPPLYIYQKEVLPMIEEFLKEKHDRPLKERDAPGLFLSWLCTRKPVYGQTISGRFDVGNLDDYQKLCDYFGAKK